MPKELVIQWLPEPEDHNYPAAHSYLSLLFDEVKVGAIVGRLRSSPVTEFKAKDIFRASGLGLLGISNSHVARDQKKIDSGRALSPLLLVRDASRLIVADGYHRLCAIYSYDEDATIRCKIV